MYFCAKKKNYNVKNSETQILHRLERLVVAKAKYTLL